MVLAIRRERDVVVARVARLSLIVAPLVAPEMSTKKVSAGSILTSLLIVIAIVFALSKAPNCSVPELAT